MSLIDFGNLTNQARQEYEVRCHRFDIPAGYRTLEARGTVCERIANALDDYELQSLIADNPRLLDWRLTDGSPSRHVMRFDSLRSHMRAVVASALGHEIGAMEEREAEARMEARVDAALLEMGVAA